MTARQTLLDGLARDMDIFELMSELLPLHPRDSTFPGEVFLRLAGDALDWCGASRAGPLALEGLRERFLPECTSAAGKTPSSSTRCSAPRPCMAGPTRTCLMGSPVASRRLLAVRPVRGGRLHPRRRQPGGRAGTPGMPDLAQPSGDPAP